MLSQKAPLNPYSHGSARWADREDIEAAGLMPRKRSLLDRLRGKEAPSAASVYVGGWVDKRDTVHYLRHSGPEQCCAMRPPVRARVSV